MLSGALGLFLALCSVRNDPLVVLRGPHTVSGTKWVSCMPCKHLPFLKKNLFWFIPGSALMVPSWWAQESYGVWAGGGAAVAIPGSAACKASPPPLYYHSGLRDFGFLTVSRNKGDKLSMELRFHFKKILASAVHGTKWHRILVGTGWEILLQLWKGDGSNEMRKSFIISKKKSTVSFLLFY